MEMGVDEHIFVIPTTSPSPQPTIELIESMDNTVVDNHEAIKDEDSDTNALEFVSGTKSHFQKMCRYRPGIDFTQT